MRYGEATGGEKKELEAEKKGVRVYVCTVLEWAVKSGLRNGQRVERDMNLVWCQVVQL